MTTYASGQQSIAAQPNYAYPGDYYGVPGLAGSSSAATGFIATTDVLVGQFAWVIDGLIAPGTNNQLTQLQGSNTRAVFVPRENANTYSNADLNQGWSLTIPAGYQLEACANGSFYAAVNSLNSGGGIVVNDTVCVKIADGTTWTVTGAAPTGYYDTGYVVVDPAVPNTFGINQVIISNVQAI